MIDKYYVYGRPNCPFCEKAKELLEERRAFYEYIDITKDADAKEWFLEAGFKKVPQIYLENKHIGGYNDLAAHFRKSQYE